MRIGATLAVAFSMYSRIPMPSVEWNEKNMRYALCAFPLVGIVQGTLCFAWGALSWVIPLPALVLAAGFTVIPLWVNGGIHLDGLADTADALASHAPKEKKLEILKDPHIGAFGVIALIVHILLMFALFTGFIPTVETMVALVGMFVLSRCLSGWAIVRWPLAKAEGTARSFHDGSAGAKAAFILAVWALLAVACLVISRGLVGGGMVMAAAMVMLSYRLMAMKNFGGVTGDLAGWFLQMAELAMLAVLVIGGLVL